MLGAGSRNYMSERNAGSVMLRHFRNAAVVFLAWACMASLAPARAATKEKNVLPPHYKEWLDRDVCYLITRGEKSDFLKLRTDDERDQFIEHFWEIRNPDPGSPMNTFKEEHYKRLAYAEDHFSIGKRVPGWATPRGQIYIVLGEPKQMQTYQGYDRVRPMQIWFYESPSPAVPPYFYVLFYKQDSFGDYRTYSPYFDGPQELVTERGVTTPEAIQMIQRDVGQEVARISLSLLPDEPVNTQNPIPSMQSDIVMSVVHDLANSPMNVDMLQRRAALMQVTSRLIVGGETLGVLTTPLRDADGTTKVHYLMRLKRPEDFTIAKNVDGVYYFSVDSRVQVYSPDDKLIFTQERSLKHTVVNDDVEQIKAKVFGYEGWLPLPPGKYHLKFLLTNWVNNVGYQGESNVVVPDITSSGMIITPLVPFSSAQQVQPELSGLIPFSVAGMRFTPLLSRELNLTLASNLQFFYQIWAGRAELFNASAGDMQARYAFGRPAGVGEARVVTDPVSISQFDPTGTILTGKKIPLVDMLHGNYLLTLALNTPDGRQKASATLPFHVMSDPPNAPDWDVFDGEGIAKDVKDGIADYQRAQCYLAFNDKEGASQWLRNALVRNPREEEARTALVNIEFGKQDYAGLAKLAHDVPISADTDDETILRLAEALDKTGSTNGAIDLLQSAIKLKSPDGPMYLTLASYYRRVGDTKKGDDFEKKGRAIEKKNPQPEQEPVAKQATTKE